MNHDIKSNSLEIGHQKPICGGNNSASVSDNPNVTVVAWLDLTENPKCPFDSENLSFDAVSTGN
jgi:hypothetical protein